MNTTIRRYALTTVTLGIASLLVIVFGILARADRIGYDLPEYDPVDVSSVDRIVIERPSGTVSLNRSREGWRVNPGDYAAHIPSVTFFLESMAELNITDVVSLRDDPGRFGLDPDQRLRVSLLASSDELRVVYIGRRAASYGHTYVSVPGDDRILQAVGELRATFDRGVDVLREKGVMAFDTTKVTGIRVTLLSTNGSTTITAAPGETGWAASDGTAEVILKDDEIEELLAFLAGFSAYQFRYESPVEGEPWLEVRVLEDQTHTIYVYPKDGSVYPARTSQSEYAFNMLAFQPGLILTPFGLQVPEG